MKFLDQRSDSQCHHSSSISPSIFVKIISWLQKLVDGLASPSRSLSDNDRIRICAGDLINPSVDDFPVPENCPILRAIRINTSEIHIASFVEALVVSFGNCAAYTCSRLRSISGIMTSFVPKHMIGSISSKVISKQDLHVSPLSDNMAPTIPASRSKKV